LGKISVVHELKAKSKLTAVARQHIALNHAYVNNQMLLAALEEEKSKNKKLKWAKTDSGNRGKGGIR
jgi:hypothetical protein